MTFCDFLQKIISRTHKLTDSEILHTCSLLETCLLEHNYLVFNYLTKSMKISASIILCFFVGFYFSVQQLQHIPIEMGSPIVQCSIADPYIIIMSDEGSIMMLTLKQESTGARLVLSKPLIQSVSSSVYHFLWARFVYEYIRERKLS